MYRGGGRVGRGGSGTGTGQCTGRGQQRHRSSNSAPSPALLTSYIKKAWTIDALFDTCSAHQDRFNHIHLSACWSKLGQLSGGGDRRWFEKHAAALASLVTAATRTVCNSPDIRARELANISHGVAKSGRGGDARELMEALARAMEPRLCDCNAQELANTAWAFAKVGHPDGQFLMALGRVATPRLSDFNPQELTNTAWAFATAGVHDPPLFAALARVAEHRLGGFNTQGLANTALAFAKAGVADAALFTSMARVVKQRLSDFNTQDLANTAWAFAKVGQFDAALFAALARMAEKQLATFNAQGLANTAWAFAKAGQLDAELFGSLVAPIQSRMRDFNSQDLANTAWAFAKACHLDERLFTSLAASTRACLSDFNTQDLVNTAWAFAKVGHLDATLFPSLAASIATRGLDDLNAQGLANVAWAFAKAGHPDGRLFTALGASAEQRVNDFSAQDLADIAWAFANAGHLESRLFASLAASTERCIDQFDEEALDNAEWAFTRAGQQKVAQRLRQRRKRSGWGVVGVGGAVSEADCAKCGRIVIAGGGIGGAAAAVALQKKGFDVMVLEADASFDSRAQGYGLTIQRQDATQALGISLAQDDAPSTSHYTFSSDGRIINFYGEAFGSKTKDRREFDNSGRFMHVPRQVLRARLLERIRPGTIRWNSKVKGFSCWSDAEGGAPDKNGVTITLTDGTTLDAALLVASDGIFSTVRRQLRLPGDRLNYVGLLVVLGIVEGSSSGMGVPPLAQRRIFETVDGVTRVYAMPFTTTSTMWQLSFPCTEEDARGFSQNSDALRTEILRRCAQWHDPIPALIRATPPNGMSGYPVFDRETLSPATLRSAQNAPQRRRVTLIGDAAHPMTPFRAQGANQALLDAILLADALADGVRREGAVAGLDVALPLFERKMLNRAARAVVASREKAKELHSALALQPARKAQRETGVDMRRVVRALRAKGIVAQCANDPRGLDAVVEEAAQLRAGTSSSGNIVSSAGRKDKRGREAAGEDDTETETRKRKREGLEAVTLKVLKKSGGAAGMRRLKLRKKVLLAMGARAGASVARKRALREEWERMVRGSARLRVEQEEGEGEGGVVYAV